MYWRLVREVLKTDPWFMMRVALEWAWLDEDLVGHKFIRHVAENWGTDLAVLFPRGHGKTLPMQSMVLTNIINDPNVAILQISRTQDNADKFGQMVGQHLIGNDYLQRCFGRKYNDEGPLPNSIAECSSWGRDGYSLPYRKPRLDPTLLCISLKSAKAGKHPDWIYIDDPTEKENNNPEGWEHVRDVIDGCKMLLTPDGFFCWTGTRWHDGDPLGYAEAGKLRGKQGAFMFIKESCYVDDNVKKPPTYPRKIRWNMDKMTGYTPEMLDALRKPKDEGGLGEFFDAQMRNDPAPAERADIKIKDINIYKPDAKDDEPGPKLPKIGPVRLFGIETTGGGTPIFSGFQEHLEEMKMNIPIYAIEDPKRAGIEKRDKIVSALQPIVNAGRLYAQEWMIGDEAATEGLGYELRRLGKASHDDIADALHAVPSFLAKNLRPASPNDPADLYIAADLAWTEKKRADWTVLIAVAVDYQGNFWILDYDRFQISSPTGMFNRFIAFYQKFSEEASVRKISRRKFAGTWR